MSGFSLRENTSFNVDNEYIDRFIKTINTILIGTVISIEGNKAVVNISNKYPKLMSDGTVKYTPYGQVTTNFGTPTMFKYVPKPTDVVLIFVIQTNAQDILNGDETDYPHNFNVFDSVLLPLDIAYSDSSKITVGDNSLDMSLSAKEYDLSTEKFAIINSVTADNLLTIIANTFTAIGSVSVGGSTIDALTGGVVGVNSAKISGFS